MSLELSASRAYPVAAEDAFDALVHRPLPEIFGRRYAAIPDIREVREQTDDWGAVGSSRRIVLGDGSTFLEVLTAVDRPRSVAHRLSEPTGPMRAAIAGIDGRFDITPVGTGAEVRWSWWVEPHGALGRLAMPAFAFMWRGYARQALEQLERVLIT